MSTSFGQSCSQFASLEVRSHRVQELQSNGSKRAHSSGARSVGWIHKAFTSISNKWDHEDVVRTMPRGRGAYIGSGGRGAFKVIWGTRAGFFGGSHQNWVEMQRESWIKETLSDRRAVVMLTARVGPNLTSCVASWARSLRQALGWRTVGKTWKQNSFWGIVKGDLGVAGTVGILLGSPLDILTLWLPNW